MRLSKLLVLSGLALSLLSLNSMVNTSYAEEEIANTNATPVAPAPANVKRDANGFYVNGPVYVSDQNRVWTRSGPSENYRVTGSRKIGEEMTFLRYSENGKYVQLASGEDKFWMPLESVQAEPAGETLTKMLNEKIAGLQYRLDNYDSEISKELKQATKELNMLRKENAELKKTLDSKEATIQELDELHREYADRLQTKEFDLQMRWWVQGALIAFAGALAGVIFIFIPRPSRKQRRERY